MTRSLVVGGTGRLGSAVTERLRARGDTVFAMGRLIPSLPEGVNYAVFCQRYRGPVDPCGEWRTSVLLTERIMNELGWADEGDCAAVIVSSIVGVEADGAHPADYQCAKAAQVHLAHHLTRKLGVRVNVVAPGAFTGLAPVVTIAEVADAIVKLCAPSERPHLVAWRKWGEGHQWIKSEGRWT